MLDLGLADPVNQPGNWVDARWAKVKERKLTGLAHWPELGNWMGRVVIDGRLAGMAIVRDGIDDPSTIVVEHAGEWAECATAGEAVEWYRLQARSDSAKRAFVAAVQGDGRDESERAALDATIFLLLDRAQGLVSEPGKNPEYERALVELIEEASREAMLEPLQREQIQRMLGWEVRP